MLGICCNNSRTSCQSPACAKACVRLLRLIVVTWRGLSTASKDASTERCPGLTLIDVWIAFHVQMLGLRRWWTIGHLWYGNLSSVIYQPYQKTPKNMNPISNSTSFQVWSGHWVTESGRQATAASFILVLKSKTWVQSTICNQVMKPCGIL